MRPPGKDRSPRVDAEAWLRRHDASVRRELFRRMDALPGVDDPTTPGLDDMVDEVVAEYAKELAAGRARGADPRDLAWHMRYVADERPVPDEDAYEEDLHTQALVSEQCQ